MADNVANPEMAALIEYVDKYHSGKADRVYRYVHEMFREAIRTLSDRDGERVNDEIARQIVNAADSMAREIIEGRGEEIAARQVAANYAAWCEARDYVEQATA